MASSKPALSSFIFKDRDIAILRGFLECRVMSGAHVAELHFDGREESAKKGLQRLKRAKLIAECPRDPIEPAILYLTQGGLASLRKLGVLKEYPHSSLPPLVRRAELNPRTLQHELEVMDAKVAFLGIIRRRTNLSLQEFATSPLLIQFRVLGSTLKPDGFIRVDESDVDGNVSEHRFFLEVDRSTEPQATLSYKAFCYREHRRSHQYPFRVLFILKTEERRNNTAEMLLRFRPPILTQAWLTTLSELNADPLGAIWIRPLDYRDAAIGTPFDPSRRPEAAAYRKQAPRERFMREKVVKHRLFPG